VSIREEDLRGRNMQELAHAEVAFGDDGRCIKHRLAETRLPQEMNAEAIQRLNGFQLDALIRTAQSTLWAVQESCDHLFKEHSSHFYCVRCGYHYVEAETYHSCACKQQDDELRLF